MANKNCCNLIGTKKLIKRHMYENILTSRPSKIYWVQTGVYRNRGNMIFFSFSLFFGGGQCCLLFIYLCQRMVPALRVQVLYTVCNSITLKELHECFLFGVRL